MVIATRKKSLTTVSCDDALLEDEYTLDAKSVKVTTLLACGDLSANAGILKSN